MSTKIWPYLARKWFKYYTVSIYTATYYIHAEKILRKMLLVQSKFIEFCKENSARKAHKSLNLSSEAP